MNDLQALLTKIDDLRAFALSVASGPLSDMDIKLAIKKKWGLAAAMRPETIRRIRQAVMAVF